MVQVRKMKSFGGFRVALKSLISCWLLLAVKGEKYSTLVCSHCDHLVLKNRNKQA